jgi:hypothetical protein
MKTLFRTAFVLIALALYGVNCLGQNCDKLLEGGLYSFTTMTNTGSFSKDLRTYYLSEQFKTDMKSGKWGSSVTIPVEGVPITLGMDFSQDSYTEFKNKLMSQSELKIQSDFYKTVYSTIPNTNLYQAYVDCINADVSKTGFVQGTNIETENTVVFSIYYRPQAEGDPMPTIKSFNVEPSGNIISGNLTRGQKLSSLALLVTCERDPDRDMILTLNTDRGTFVSKSIAEGSMTSSINLPLGTVITSFLSYEQFNAATKNNEKSPGGIFTSSKSKWSPCDGRPLPGSKYQKFSSQNNAPDLRGIFLRGLNTFDPSYTIAPQDGSQLAPDISSLGTYQKDALANHQHQILSSKNVLRYIEGGNLKGGDGAAFMSAAGVPGKGDAAMLITDNDGGGQETRPKNVATYYYIKIN